MSGEIHLAVALDGAGWHPAAWRLPTARPDDLFDARYWVDLVQTAERGTLDFVTFEDAFTLQSANPWRPDDRVDQVRGRLDAALVATRVAPMTQHVGLVPTVTTTHTEPFHVSTKVASLDHISGGRAGWRVQVLRQAAELELFGRRTIPSAGDAPLRDPSVVATLFADAADSVEAARRLWDSWEDDAEIRDRPSGRFIDRDKLHYVDFVGEGFSVRGPSITPRPPQGQPLVTLLAHGPIVFDLAARCADVVFVTPHSVLDVETIIEEVRRSEARVERAGTPLRVFADLLVFLGDDAAETAAAKVRLDELDGAPLQSDALVVVGTPGELADLLVEWNEAGVDGFRLRPARLPVDLDAIVDGVVPELRARTAFRHEYEERTLRERLELERPTNRYETIAGVHA